MRNTPLKAFVKSPIKHSEKDHKAEHVKKDDKTGLVNKLKEAQKKIPKIY